MNEEPLDLIDLSAKPITDADIIDFIQAVYEFRINDELPFHTVDYYHMERLLEYMRGKNGK